MIGWHRQLDGHEFEPTVGESEGQGSRACRSLWDLKESDTTESLNNSNALLLWNCITRSFHVLDPHTSHVLILVLILKVLIIGTSLIVQMLKIYASSAEGKGSICSCGTKIQHAVRHS